MIVLYYDPQGEKVFTNDETNSPQTASSAIAYIAPPEEHISSFKKRIEELESKIKTQEV